MSRRNRSLSVEDNVPEVTSSQQATSPGGSGCVRGCWTHPLARLLKAWWRVIVIITTPLVFLPLVIPLDIAGWNLQAARAGFTIAVVAVFWLTEVVPIAVTGLLPLILFPALGVLPADAVSRNYLKDTAMLFVGGLMMAVAVEKWNLHKRIALTVMRIMGARPRWLLLGFMGTTAFLSMWISNTATAAMMLPIAKAVLEEIKEENRLSANKPSEGTVRYRKLDESAENITTLETLNESSIEISNLENGGTEAGRSTAVDAEDTKDIQESQLNTSQVESSSETSQLLTVPSQPQVTSAADRSFNRMAKSMMLGVAYAANIGGTATLTGTGPNIVLAGLASDLGINFGLWFVFAAPAMILALVLTWLYLSLLFCDDSFLWCKRRVFRLKVHSLDSSRAKHIIREQYNKLGRIRYAEVLVLVMFILLVLLWFTREPKFIPGWSVLFPTDDQGESFFSDSSTALFVVFLLFLIPSQPTCPSNWISAGSSPRLLDWDTVQSTFPWYVILVLGSGFALAAGAEESGLSALIGQYLTVLQCLPTPVIAFLVSFIAAMVTEVLSNVATTTLFLPVLRGLAIELCINPLYLMIPATVSSSYAFMLPVATPPNTIAFSYGYLKVYDMVLTGFFLNLLCIGLVSLSVNTLGLAVFDLNTFPAINGTNCTINYTLSC